MPRPPNKRKEHLAGVEDAIAKRRKTSKLLEDRLNVPKDDSRSIDAIAAPDTISSSHGEESTPEAEAEADAATNTALPDVVTSLPPADADVDADADDDSNKS
jgi:hypothetical protein